MLRFVWDGGVWRDSAAGVVGGLVFVTPLAEVLGNWQHTADHVRVPTAPFSREKPHVPGEPGAPLPFGANFIQVAATNTNIAFDWSPTPTIILNSDKTPKPRL
jgi:hypothetical protein